MQLYSGVLLRQHARRLLGCEASNERIQGSNRKLLSRRRSALKNPHSPHCEKPNNSIDAEADCYSQPISTALHAAPKTDEGSQPERHPNQHCSEQSWSITWPHQRCTQVCQ